MRGGGGVRVYEEGATLAMIDVVEHQSAAYPSAPGSESGSHIATGMSSVSLYTSSSLSSLTMSSLALALWPRTRQSSHCDLLLLVDERRFTSMLRSVHSSRRRRRPVSASRQLSRFSPPPADSVMGVDGARLVGGGLLALVGVCASSACASASSSSLYSLLLSGAE